MCHERDNHLITLLGRKITLDFKNEWKCFKIKWQMENNTWAHVDMEFVRLDSSSDKFQDEKTRIIAKQTMGATQFTKFSDIDFFHTEENRRNTFKYTAKIGLWQIFQLSIDFRSQPREMPLPKLLST